MSRFRTTRGAVLAVLAILPVGAPAAEQRRESVLDRVVHIEEGVRDVPEVPRLETEMALRVRHIDVGDAELHVEEEGSGMPLVLINGGPGGTHHYFHPWFSRASDYARVVYYDQRGTGLSDFEPGENGYSVEQAVADLDALRVSLGIDKGVLLGYSYGGFLAQYYTTMHPGNAAGLVLVGAKPGLWADLGDSRQYDCISEAEIDRMREAREELRQLRRENDWPVEEYLQRLLYSNFINGDWKRQRFYKPTPRELASIARYEWINDRGFNRIMNQSAAKVNLAGAFEDSPIPTLLIEGKWDLTWGEEKLVILSRNHPEARMVVIEGAGHAVFSENPAAFFGQLESFVRGLEKVPDSEIAAFQQHLSSWRSAWQSSPRYLLRAAGPGENDSRQLATAYSSDWLGQLDRTTDLRRAGYALYDSQRYEEALQVFVLQEEVAAKAGSHSGEAAALIWQGHMLDLLSRREEAQARYRRVVDMGLTDDVRHDQYDLAYEYGPYATERLERPFERVQNRLP